MKWNGFDKCYISKSCLFFLLFEKRLYNLMYSICKNYFNCWLAEYTTYDYVCYIFHEMWAIKREHCLSVPACTGSCSDCHLVGDLRRGSILFMLFQSTDWATWGKKNNTQLHTAVTLLHCDRAHKSITHLHVLQKWLFFKAYNVLTLSWFVLCFS